DGEDHEPTAKKHPLGASTGRARPRLGSLGKLNDGLGDASLGCGRGLTAGRSLRVLAAAESAPCQRSFRQRQGRATVFASRAAGGIHGRLDYIRGTKPRGALEEAGPATGHFWVTNFAALGFDPLRSQDVIPVKIPRRTRQGWTSSHDMAS